MHSITMKQKLINRFTKFNPKNPTVSYLIRKIIKALIINIIIQNFNEISVVHNCTHAFSPLIDSLYYNSILDLLV